MPRFRRSIPIDDYVIDVLMPDLVGHDQHPAAFLVYLFLYHRAQQTSWKSVAFSLRAIAQGTGLSKSGVQTALVALHRRQLIKSLREHCTAIPRHQVLRHWRERRHA